MSRVLPRRGILIKAHVIAEVVWEKHVILGMLQLFPVAVVADLFLVLLAKRLAVETVAGCKRGDAYRRGLNLPLLKKQRTPHSGASRRIRTAPNRS